MAWKPNTRTQEYPSGRAKLAFKKGKGLVHFSPDQDSPFAGRKYKVQEWPSWMKKDAAAHEWQVKLGKEQIFSAHPWKGFFRGKFAGLAAKEGEKPVPKVMKSQYGDYLAFTALIEITEGPKGTVGAVVPYFLRYNFGEDKDGLVEFTHGGSNAVHTPRLETFLDACGAWEAGELKFSDNLLPKLEKRMLKAKKELVFQIKDGWIVSESLDNEDAPLEDSDAALWDADDDDAPF